MDDEAWPLNLNDLQLFVQAVESGGFAAAARRLGIPKSTVSKRVAELEDALGGHGHSMAAARPGRGDGHRDAAGTHDRR